MVERTALPVGDYMVRLSDGRVAPVAIERKSLADLWGTMTKGYPRFKSEMEKAHELGLYLILGVEASWSKIAHGYAYSDFAGESMVKKLLTLWVRHSLTPLCCHSRAELSSVICELFASLERHYAIT